MTPILRQLIATRPFRPFRLVLTGGWEVPVSTAAGITIPDDETARVHTDDGRLHIIDLRHLVEIRS